MNVAFQSQVVKNSHSLGFSRAFRQGVGGPRGFVSYPGEYPQGGFRDVLSVLRVFRSGVPRTLALYQVFHLHSKSLVLYFRV